MRSLTYLITICLLIISSQVYSQNLCEPDFLSSNITPTSCGASEGAIDITLTGGIGPFAFSWSGPNIMNVTTEDISGLMEGLYTVIITDANNEECVEFFEVNDGGPICTAFVENADCNGFGQLEITCVDGVPPYTFLWSDGSTTQNIINAVVGTYAVTVTDANGCEFIEIFTVNTDANSFCDTLYIDPIQVSVGNQIRVDFVATEFDDIVSMQYTMHYDQTTLQFESLGNFSTDLQQMSIGNFNTNNPGYITFSWVDSATQGITLPDGSILYSVFFTPLSTDDSEIYISGIPTPIEITNGDWNQVYLDASSTTVLVEGNVLSGQIYHDENSNCQNDGETTLRNWPIHLTDGVDEWNIVSNDVGYYSVVVPDGTYDLNITPINENWGVCNNGITLDIAAFETQDFGAVALFDCPVMEVDIAIPTLRRCFENQIYLSYCNYGTVTATNAYIELELDPDMVFVSASVTPSSINGNLVSFDIGDIVITDCGQLSLSVLLDENCDATVLSQTHCTTATIFPNAPCDVDPLWDGASLELTGSCDGTNVNFVIENVGTGNMNQPSSFIVIEDHVMGQSIPEDFILTPGESITISKPANGSTYYMNVNQVPYHPGHSNPSVAVEGCGTNASGGISLGVVTQYGQNDGDGFVDIECVQNIGSYDPNDKAAMLKGFGDEHFIYANEPMEYLIRFQNTGTASAINVEVEDELSPFFDITSLRLGASSHEYTFSIKDERTMVFTFENINLPDSTTDLSGSNGFITYKVDQLLDNPDGTVLENTAAIYFDFNEAIITSTTTHTIGSEFVTTATFYDDLLQEENAISVFPNPSDNIMTFELEEWNTNMHLEVFNLTGKQLLTQHFDSEKIVLSKETLNEGMYFYTISSNGTTLTSGKFLFL